MASRQAGFTEQELYDAGLAQRSREDPRRVYDRFRARIMFPLRDSRGRVLGFGARAMSDDQPAKYINTSDNEIYHKAATSTASSWPARRQRRRRARSCARATPT